MSLSDYIPAKFLELFTDPDFSTAIKGYCRFLINEDPEFQADIDNRIVLSELRPIQRIAQIEKLTGVYHFEEDEEHDQTIPEKIEVLEEKIQNADFRPIEKPIEIKEPTTRTEHRATLLVRALEDSNKDYFTANEIVEFLKCKLPDFCKVEDTVKNIRKVKQDVVRMAKDMFPQVDINKKKVGHRDVRLILKSRNLS